MTKIQWTDKTWNPVRGCSRVSEGCRNCYAEKQAARFNGPGQPYVGLVKRVGGEARWTGVIRVLKGDTLTAPLRWQKPRRVFVNSMSDLFHENLPDEAIDRIFAVMALCPQHTFQVLTKRPERMQQYMSCNVPLCRLANAIEKIEPVGTHEIKWVEGSPSGRDWPLPNVWLGTSVENQATADERIPLLLDTPAAVRFVSYEPALALIDFRQIRVAGEPHAETHNALTGHSSDTPWHFVKHKLPAPFTRGRLDWIIVGGESGPNARPFDIAWARSVIAQCKAAGVAVFIKQLGRHPCQHVMDGFVLAALELNDRKGGEMSEWPSDLQVREFPKAQQRNSA